MSLSSKTNSHSLTCITGPMFSGKTTKLLETITKLPKKEVLCLKPKIDNRYKPEMICTHNGDCIKAIPISKISEALELAKDYRTIAIDEVQFFGEELTTTVNELLKNGHQVILSGLEKDYLHKRFGALETLKEQATHYYKLNGICNSCNMPSTHTFRINKTGSQVLIGESKQYIALCKNCYENKMRS